MTEYEQLKAQKDDMVERERQAIIVEEAARIRAMIRPRQYQLVYSDDPSEFQMIVNRKLLEGWHPQGGVSVSPDSFRCAFAQAMVKY